MANEINSPLRRAHISVAIWLNILPKDARLDAKMALDRLVDMAEKEIEQAFHAGQEFTNAARRAAGFDAPSQSK